MATLRACALIVILCLLILDNTDAYQLAPSNSPIPAPVPAPGPKIDCGGACAYRCSKTKRPNLCKRTCGGCCNICNCVPPGTYGHYEACPCYYKLTTRKKNKLVRKCP